MLRLCAGAESAVTSRRTWQLVMFVMDWAGVMDWTTSWSWDGPDTVENPPTVGGGIRQYAGPLVK